MRVRTPSLRLVAALLMVPLLTGLALSTDTAQACFCRATQPVHVYLDHIKVTIQDQVAVKTYDCTFKNPNASFITGATCYMELEPGAQVDDMTVLVDGKEMRADILGVEEAKKVFQDIVKEGGSPALLEYYGNQLIQTQVPQIAPGGTVNVRLRYTTVLKSQGGLVRMQMLNTNPKAEMQKLKSAAVEVKLSSKQAIKNVYSPTHDIKIEEAEDADVVVRWSAEDYLPKTPFVLYYQLADDPIGASLLTHRELGKTGHFLMMLSPTVGPESPQSALEVLPKDIVFCVDTSGSMVEGGKMDQAQEALKYCLEKLRPGDRFNLVDFSTAARTFRDGEMVPANQGNIDAALAYVKGLAPRGGTAIEQALDRSLKLLEDDNDRLKMILFATDGLPTIGQRDPQEILKGVEKANKQDVRIFVFGEGFNVNTRLLDFLALNHRGEADYVLPEEDISARIGRFFDRIGSPLLTDLEVSFGDLKVMDVYPTTIADIYRGEQVLIYGQYRGQGEKKIKLRGKSTNGEVRELEFTLTFPEFSEDAKSDFVPRLWAGKKVDFLLNQLRRSESEDQELIDEITLLARRYGIVTPYTSFLMGEDIVPPGTVPPGGFGGGPVPMPAWGNQVVREKLRANAAPAADAAGKALQVQEARQQADNRRDIAKGTAAALYDRAEQVLKNAGAERKSALEQIRYIGSRTFYRNGQTWYDSDYDDKAAKPREVQFRSDEYFDLLAKHADLAQYLALGDVMVEHAGQWYHFQK